MEESREFQLDEADFQLQNAVKNGEPWAVQFTLRTLGRDRGYGEGLIVNSTVTKKMNEDFHPEDLTLEEGIELERLLKKGYRGEWGNTESEPEQPIDGETVIE